ncbi:MAG: alanine--tRNA ligase-related protein, partial [Acidobacteriota bacterium]
GMGFERLVTVLQGKKSNYDTDVFSPLMEAIRQETGAAPYAGLMASTSPTAEQMRDVTYRILADHLRCLSFAITDGALPDNDGRGYVLRRILRRAYRYGRQYLDVDRPFLHRLVPSVVDSLGDAFPELRAGQDRVVEAIHEEEESFARTLNTGLKLFATAAEKVEADGQDVIDGETAFKLHDTYGFPIDLTTIIAGERGLTVDADSFRALMEAAKDKARAAQKADADGATVAIMAALAKVDTEFFEATRTDDSSKFRSLESEGQVVGWLDAEGTFGRGALEAGRDVGLVLSSTCFYAEQGGQVGDRGQITTAAGGRFEVIDTQRAQDTVLHIGRLVEGGLETGQAATARVDAAPRQVIMANHTATHLLNHALRDVLGEHVQQRGSLVDADKTRFDFSHRSSLTDAEIDRIEAHVADQIAADHTVYDAEVPLEDAKAVNSLRAVFGEKYPDCVRVVSIGVPVADLLADKANDDWRGYSI